MEIYNLKFTRTLKENFNINNFDIDKCKNFCIDYAPEFRNDFYIGGKVLAIPYRIETKDTYMLDDIILEVAGACDVDTDNNFNLNDFNTYFIFKNVENEIHFSFLMELKGENNYMELDLCMTEQEYYTMQKFIKENVYQKQM